MKPSDLSLSELAEWKELIREVIRSEIRQDKKTEGPKRFAETALVPATESHKLDLSELYQGFFRRWCKDFGYEDVGVAEFSRVVRITLSSKYPAYRAEGRNIIYGVKLK